MKFKTHAVRSYMRRAMTVTTLAASVIALNVRYQGGLNVSGIVSQMMEDSSLTNLMNNPLAQFGPQDFPFLGATILPERTVQLNAFVEEGIEWRTVIANDATRYSPVQIKNSALYGSVQVILGNADTGSEFKGQDYDAFITALQRFGQADGLPSMEAVSKLLSWVDKTLLRPLLVKAEKQRWEALQNAQVVRTGDGGYREVVNFPNPSGQRVNVGGTWSSDSYDPYPDIIDMAEFLWNKGYTVNRIVTRRTVTSKLSLNAFIRQRVGRVSIMSGTVVGLAGRASMADVNELLSADGLPPIESYDLQYRTQNGTAYYIDSGSMLFICTTGRDEELDLGDAESVIVPNTLGYVGVGRPAGASAPGRVLDIAVKTDKPPRLEGQSWGTFFPVITIPEGVGVLKNIT